MGPQDFWISLSASSLSFQGSSAFEDPGETPDAWAAERPQKQRKPKKQVMRVVCVCPWPSQHLRDNLQHFVPKPTCIEVVDVASRAFRPGSVAAP